MVVRPCFKTVTPRQNVAIFTRLSPKKSGLLVTVTLTVNKKTHRVATVGFIFQNLRLSDDSVGLESVAQAHSHCAVLAIVGRCIVWLGFGFAQEGVGVCALAQSVRSTQHVASSFTCGRSKCRSTYSGRSSISNFAVTE